MTIPVMQLTHNSSNYYVQNSAYEMLKGFFPLNFLAVKIKKEQF